ncbi:MAG: hypothetical protein KBT34_12110 [Prevotella sp.]|nr:hypothetical protein [Candidatus Prevotella equi]
MAIYGGVFDSFTGAAVKANVYLLREDSTIVKQPTAKDSVLVDTLGVEQFESWETKRMQVRYHGVMPKQKGNYILKAEHEDYETLFLPLNINKVKNFIEAPDLKMKRRIHKSADLDEVVVKATKIQMVYRGDTLVYDATAFVLPEGSMLDGLIRQLPGAELSSEGEITINGKKVDNLTLNGKDFFKGDNKVMLENLPYFTVKELKAYDKTDEKSAALGLPAEQQDKTFTLDVVLKKEFQRGYIANAEIGGGTKERWMAKLFGLMYGERYRLAMFGNANNVNEERSPGKDGDWDPSKTSRGLITTRQAGVHHEISDKFSKWSNTLDAKASWQDTKNEQAYRSERYRTEGNIFSSGFNNNKSKNNDFKITEKFQLEKPYWLRADAELSYATRDNNSASADSTWQTRLTNSSESLSKSLRKTFNASGRVNFSNRTPWDYGSYDINVNAAYERTNPAESFSFNRTNIFSVDGVKPDLRNRYGDNASWRYNYATAARLGQYFTKPKINLSLTFNYRQMMQHSDNLSYRLDSLGGRYASDPYILPSTYDSLAIVTDINNSYQYNTLSRNYMTRLGISKSFYKTDGEKEPRHRGSIYLDFPLEISNERIDFWRPTKTVGRSNQQTASRTLHTFNPYLYFYWETKRTEWYINMQRQEDPNSLTSLVDMSNTSNPLYFSFSNPSLKTACHYNFNVRLDVKCDSIPLTYWLKAECYLGTNYHGSRRWYNSKTGGYVSMDDNVNGNVNSKASAGLNWQFDKQKRWRLTMDGFLQYHRSVDFALQTVEFDGTPTLEQLHTLTPSPELSTVNNINTNLRLILNYKNKLFTAGLLGRIDGRHSRSNREDYQDLDAYEYKFGANCTYTTPKSFGSFTIATDYNVFIRRGYQSSEINTTTNAWNASISKSFLKGSLVAKFSAYDILHQVSNIGYNVNAQGYTERRYNSIPRYVMFSLSYRLSKKPKK